MDHLRCCGCTGLTAQIELSGETVPQHSSDTSSDTSSDIRTALVVVAHHRSDSLTAHTARRAAARVEAAGYRIDLLDLHAEGFDPRMSVEDQPDWGNREKRYWRRRTLICAGSLMPTSSLPFSRCTGRVCPLS